MKITFMKKIFILLIFSVFYLSAQADIILPAFFSDDMVLQQQSQVKIWGKAEPNKKVSVLTAWNVRRYKTVADENGDWEVLVSTGKAGGPYSITITDGKIKRLNNILLGEVWLCSGQSNMEMPMKGFNGQPIEGGNRDILMSENSQLRLFRVHRKLALENETDVGGRWEETLPVSVSNFSATAYYFGKMLQETLKVPVGLICSSWGGSPIEAWMSQEMLKGFDAEALPESLENLKNAHRKPSVLYQGMIHPLAGYGIKGVIWYQGENNRLEYQKYPSLFKSMTDGWRKAWGQANPFPFYICQIAPYSYNGGNSAFMREAQLKTAQQDENTHIAILMDTGEKSCIHPAKKREAGERLALLALNKSYNIGGFASESPEFKDIEVKGNEVTVNFSKAPLGVYLKSQDSENFQLAGEDKVFHPAKVKIQRYKLVVTSEFVPNPVAVRYAFEDFAVGDLFGVGELPVSSFRSDNWEE